MIVNAYIEGRDVPGPDGRYYVTEVQVDDAQGLLRFTYLADPGTDTAAVLAERTIALEAMTPPPPVLPKSPLLLVANLIQSLPVDQQQAVQEVAMQLSTGQITPEALSGS